MFSTGEGDDLRIELGLTEQRGDELLKIVKTAMDQSAHGNMYGRISHVLLSITGRKDLNDVEKVACAFLFAINISKGSKVGMPKITKIGLDPQTEMKIDCMVVAPEEVDMPEMMAVLMATLMSLLRQMPKPEAQEFCRIASISLGRIALTGDVHL